jgi:hypothetical protein
MRHCSVDATMYVCPMLKKKNREKELMYVSVHIRIK